MHIKSPDEYDLIIRSDTNTHRHTHWFMFKVTKNSPGVLKLNILNFMKNRSLIKKGMKPMAFSEKNGWGEVSNVQYFKTIPDSIKFNTVSFTFEFAEADTVTFSLCKPYSYTNLLGLFKEIEETPELLPIGKVVKAKLTYKREVLCESLGGFPIYLLTISGGKDLKSAGKRKGAVFTARVHPGETVSSYAMESFLRFLLSAHPHALSLRSQFIFKIIPMLNPDGVICGNSRTSLVGTDLNRIWTNPSPVLHPCIYFTKLFIQNFSQRREVLIYSDFHGHGKKIGSFIYGCNKIVNGSFTSWTKVRLFPRIVAKNTVMVSYNQCVFSIDPRKEGTGRVVIWKEIGISNSFTIETSLYGYHNGEKIIPHSGESFNELGESIAKSLLEYSFLLKSLEKELKLTNGWLKPSKFKEVSGVPARQVLLKRLEDEKKEQKSIQFREKAKFSTRPASKSIRIRQKEPSEPTPLLFPDWKSYFTCEEVKIAQKHLEVGIESSVESSSTESSSSDSEELLERPYSPPVENINFWVAIPRSQKTIKKELEPQKCKFIKQHTSDFSGCYLESVGLKNTSSETFYENHRNMFISRAERSKMHKEKTASIRSMSSKKSTRVIAEYTEVRNMNEKFIKVRPKIPKSYYFSQDKKHLKPPDLCVNSFQVNTLKRSSLNKL